MADDESFLTSPPTPDVAVHVQDYTRFTNMFKYGAIACFVIAMFLLIVVL